MVGPPRVRVDQCRITTRAVSRNPWSRVPTLPATGSRGQPRIGSTRRAQPWPVGGSSSPRTGNAGSRAWRLRSLTRRSTSVANASRCRFQEVVRQRHADEQRDEHEQEPAQPRQPAEAREHEEDQHPGGGVDGGRLHGSTVRRRLSTACAVPAMPHAIPYAISAATSPPAGARRSRTRARDHGHHRDQLGEARRHRRRQPVPERQREHDEQEQRRPPVQPAGRADRSRSPPRYRRQPPPRPTRPAASTSPATPEQSPTPQDRPPPRPCRPTPPSPCTRGPAAPTPPPPCTAVPPPPHPRYRLALAPPPPAHRRHRRASAAPPPPHRHLGRRPPAPPQPRRDHRPATRPANPHHRQLPPPAPHSDHRPPKCSRGPRHRRLGHIPTAGPGRRGDRSAPCGADQSPASGTAPADEAGRTPAAQPAPHTRHRPPSGCGPGVARRRLSGSRRRLG
jgi:hypothetical protein